MIIFFGPAGSGKSVQSQLLANRQGWRWLSAGQLLRDTRDPEILQTMQTGQLINFQKVSELIGKVLLETDEKTRVVLDGFPRELKQAIWLVDNQNVFKHTIDAVIVLDVPQEELFERLRIRGRADDIGENFDKRMQLYRQEITPILNYFTEKNINIIKIDGSEPINIVHDHIIEELSKCKLL